MKMRGFVSLAALLMASVVGALAADVTGKWTGDFTGPDGNAIKLAYTFRQEGAKLTGTVTGPQGDIEIAGGKVEGDKLSFTFSVMDGQMVLKNEGTVKGEEIVMVMKSDQGDFPGGSFTLTRAK